MSRLDHHIGIVRSKLTTERFLSLLGYSIAIFAGVVLLAVLVDRIFWVDLPRHKLWFWAAAGVSVLVAFIFAMVRRPTAHQAATMIDEKLGLKEKFSTALYGRLQGSNDPFVLASIQDAEKTADNISLHRRFPIAFPRSIFTACTVALVTLLVWMFMGQIDPFDHHKKTADAKKQAAALVAARSDAADVLAKVNSQPNAIKSTEKVESAKQELQQVMNQPNVDPAVLKLTAKTAQDEMDAAKKQEADQSQKFADEVTKSVFKQVNTGADDHGPVSDVSKDIAEGKFDKAAGNLLSLPEKFNSMSDDEKTKAAEQMKDLATQLAKIANDPNAMQNVQKQLQKQGITPQQVQQAMQMAQQAAQGNPQAAQQMQQQVQQMMQQMNGGKGATQQQASAIQKAMQQMQGVAGGQQAAQQMAGAAQQMAQGMQQSAANKQGGQQASAAQKNGAQTSGQASGGQQPGAQQGQGKQQANAQQPGGNQAGQQGNQQSAGQQSGGQQANGQQPGAQQGGSQQGNGSQPGGQNGNSGQQQMKQAGQQMADALQQMDAVQKDGQQQMAQANDSGGQGDQGGNGKQPGQGQGQNQNPPNNGGPPGGNGQQQGGVGGWGSKQLAQYTVKQEMDPSQSNDKGRILAKTYVKTQQDTGKSTIQLSKAEQAKVQEATDDVTEESVPKDAQNAVKEYFNTLGN